MIIFNLDGTLADCEHRRHFVDPMKAKIPLSLMADDGKWWEVDENNNPIKKWKPDYKSFYEACGKDIPIHPTINLLRTLWIKEGEEIEIWSGRCESVKNKTLNWITSYIFGNVEICPLKMRPKDDSTPDDVLKERWLDEALSQGNKIDFVFDDRPKVVRMWRRRGIFVFDCNQQER